jgi:hypothetical protein
MRTNSPSGPQVITLCSTASSPLGGSKFLPLRCFTGPLPIENAHRKSLEHKAMRSICALVCAYPPGNRGGPVWEKAP